MSKIIFIASFILFSYVGFAQEKTLSSKIASHTVSISDCNDFSCLDKVLKNKRIVMLGEEDHYDGTTFEVKVKLVKYMIEKLGFDVVGLEGLGFMESQFTPNLWKQVSSDFKDEFNMQNFDIGKFWGPLWSNTNECKPLINAINQNKIKVLGIDYYAGFLSKESFRILLNSFSTNSINNIDFPKFEKFYYETLLYGGTEDHREIKQDEYLWFLEALMTMKNAAQKEFDTGKEKKNAEVLLQLIKNTEAHYRGYMLTQKKNITEDDNLIYGNNFRDQQMMDNITWYMDRNPKHKIIIWCANSHGVRNLMQSERKVEPLMYSQIKFMGEYLFEKYGDKYYSLAFTSYEWSDGYKANDRSLEYHIAAKNVDYGFIDFTPLRYQDDCFNEPFQTYFYWGAKYAKWLNMFDGVYFIRNQKKSTPIIVN